MVAEPILTDTHSRKLEIGSLNFEIWTIVDLKWKVVKFNKFELIRKISLLLSHKILVSM